MAGLAPGRNRDLDLAVAALIARIRLSIIRRAGAVVCALLAALTFLDALR
jgi:hypothetical protein